MASGRKTQDDFNVKGIIRASNFGHKYQVVVKLDGRKWHVLLYCFPLLEKIIFRHLKYCKIDILLVKIFEFIFNYFRINLTDEVFLWK